MRLKVLNLLSSGNQASDDCRPPSRVSSSRCATIFDGGVSIETSTGPGRSVQDPNMRKTIAGLLVISGLLVLIVACATTRESEIRPLPRGTKVSIRSGEKITVCAPITLPDGYVVVYVLTNPMCGTAKENAWTIENLNGMPAESRVSCCSKLSPTPNGWLVTGYDADNSHQCGSAGGPTGIKNLVKLP